MRKFILISAFLLASASAQAGQARNLILASNDEPKAVETVKPEVTKAEAVKPVEAQPAAATTPAVATTDKADAATAKPETSKQASKPSKKAAKKHETDEAKARRIAAKYGVYW